MNQKIISSEEAVSETVGYSLLLGIVVLSVGIMIVMAFPIVSNIKDTAFVETATQAFTLLDAKSSMVAFGTSPTQITRLELNGGTVTADNSTSSLMRIYVKNSTADVEIYNKSLGTVKYVVGDQELSYEGGGVFRKSQSGEPIMISPPEFHFTERGDEGGTLTMPIIRIVSAGSVGGKGAVDIYSSYNNSPIMIYPKLSSSDYINPVYGKQIKIRIKSENYKAWAKYMVERTDATTLTNEETHEVVVSLNSKPSDQAAPLSMPIEVMGLDVTNQTPLNNFSFNLSLDAPSSSFEMDIRAPEPDSDVFHLNVQKKCGSGNTGAYITISYNDGGYNESWEACQEWIFSNNISVDLLNHSVNADYKSNQWSGTWFNETPPYNGSFKDNPGDRGPRPLDIIMQHYIKLIRSTGTFAFYKGTKTSDKWSQINESGSNYALAYNVMPPRINYLHIVERDVKIGLD